jgi:hypothetical protein
MPAMPTPTFETLLIRYNQQLGIVLAPALWGGKPLIRQQQELFDTPETRNNLYLIYDTWDKLLPVADGLLTFLKIKGLEPTINAAEGALLPSVIQRKISHVVQTPVATICRSCQLTITTTYRQQARDVLQFLEQA